MSARKEKPQGDPLARWFAGILAASGAWLILLTLVAAGGIALIAWAVITLVSSAH